MRKGVKSGEKPLGEGREKGLIRRFTPLFRRMARNTSVYAGIPRQASAYFTLYVLEYVRILRYSGEYQLATFNSQLATLISQHNGGCRGTARRAEKRDCGKNCGKPIKNAANLKEVDMK